GARDEHLRIQAKRDSAAQASFENAEVEMGRYKDLWEGGTVSKSDYDSKRLEHDVARDTLAAAKQDLEKGKAGARQEDLDAQEAQIRGLEAQLQEAQDALADTSLRAPFDGVVAKRYVENFEDVRPKERIVSIQNLDDVKIVADLPESVVAVVKKQHIEKLTVAFEGDPDTEYEVRVQEVDLEADRRTRTYAVTVTMPAPKTRRVLPGMSASLRMKLKPSFSAEGGIPVPADAVFTDAEGKSYVWIVGKDLTVTRRVVEPGEFGADHVLVRSGLKDGERVVTAGVHMIQEGWTIRLLDDATAN
ncbi:MAG: efflux RND transporter periplasmic adaptor subunit, partial [Planctomycetota bacterium]|nr:efflux RND transporter periplasmic adaptor subunit [Planctomycetota bacterium]